MAYDGSIKIDTKLETGGLEEGIKGLGGVLEKSLTSVGGMLTDGLESILKEKIVGAITPMITNLWSVIAAHPVGAAVTALSALGAAAVSWIALSDNMTDEELARQQAIDESVERTNKLTEAVKTQQAAHESSIESIRNGAGAKLAEIDCATRLADELMTLADRDGSVDEANRTRASFILGELNTALGTEYTMTGNQIGAFGDLAGKVYDVIEAEKARINLAAYSDILTEKIKNEAAAKEAAKTATAELLAEQAKAEDIIKSYTDLYNDSAIAVANNEDAITRLLNPMGDLTMEGKKLGDQYKDLDAKMTENRETIEKYEISCRETAQATLDYETAVLLAREGNYDKLNNMATLSAETQAALVSGSGDAIIAAIIANNEKIEALEKLKSGALSEEEAAYWQGQINAAITEGATLAAEYEKSGNNCVTGLGNAFKNSGYAEAEASAMAQRIINRINTKMEIRSPSRVMRDEVGAMLVKGLAIGIEENSHITLSAIDKLSSDMLAAEEKYLAEKERIGAEWERQDEEKRVREYQKRLAAAKNAIDAEEIKQTEILRLQKAADDKYLKQLKEMSEESKKLYQEQSKAVEEQKKQIIDEYTKLVAAAGKKVDEALKLQEKMADKLKKYGALYEEHTVTVKGAGEGGQDLTDSWLVMRDLTKDTEELKAYKEAIEAVRKRGASQEFLGVLKDLSVQEGTRFAQTLLNVGDEEFDSYVKAWEDKQKAAFEISKELYAEETEDTIKYVAEEFEKLGKQVPEGFFESGLLAAKSFGEGFLNKLGEVMEKMRSAVSAGMTEIMPDYSFAGGVPTVTGVSTIYNSPTYQLIPSGESTTQQLEAIRNAEEINRLRG